MNFARYIGGGGPGNFIKKKTYIIQQEEGDVVNLRDICLLDEDGKRICFNPEEDHRFEFVEKVFAVVIKELKGLGKAGKVVIVDDIASSSDGLYYGIKTLLKDVFIEDDCFQLLDHSNVVPGIDVKDAKTGLWSRIERINDAMWVQVNGSDEYRPLTDYEFSVADGETDTVRIVKCINDSGISDLSKGKQYRVSRETEQFIDVWSDNGYIQSYNKERFELS